MIAGIYPAAVTPMTPNGEIDLPGMARLVAHFRAEGCDGVVLAGTAGEGPSLSAMEKRDLVRAVCGFAEGLPVILGVITASLNEASWLCEQARKAGAAAALVMPPAYFREATEEYLAEWFEALFASTTLSILAYNFPARSGFRLSAEFMSRLAKHERFAGLKDSSGDPGNLPTYRQATRPDSALLVGDERLLIPALDHGWTGSISGQANVLGGWLAQIARELTVNRESAEAKAALIGPAIEVLKGLPQPATSKAFLHRMGIIDHPDVRLPLQKTTSPQLEVAWEAVSPFVS